MNNPIRLDHMTMSSAAAEMQEVKIPSISLLSILPAAAMATTCVRGIWSPHSFFQREIHPLADDLKHGPPAWRVRSVDDSFGSIDVPWQLASRLPQCFQ